MKVNQHTALSTSKALLVPYEAHQVPNYHRWMQDPDIQEATASEPLTLGEEYENQQSWRQAHDKLTFIICAPLAETSTLGTVEKEHDHTIARVDDADEKMRGDVNFFLYPCDDEDDGGDQDGQQATIKTDLMGEIDVMIAEKQNRGQGLGRAVVCGLMVYLHHHLSSILSEYFAGTTQPTHSVKGSESGPRLKLLMVKIKEGNAASRALFEKLGLVQQGEVNYFGEIKMVMRWADVCSREWWETAEKDYREIEYKSA